MNDVSQATKRAIKFMHLLIFHFLSQYDDWQSFHFNFLFSCLDIYISIIQEMPYFFSLPRVKFVLSTCHRSRQTNIIYLFSFILFLVPNILICIRGWWTNTNYVLPQGNWYSLWNSHGVDIFFFVLFDKFPLFNRNNIYCTKKNNTHIHTADMRNLIENQKLSTPI